PRARRLPRGWGGDPSGAAGGSDRSIRTVGLAGPAGPGRGRGACPGGPVRSAVRWGGSAMTSQLVGGARHASVPDQVGRDPAGRSGDGGCAGPRRLRILLPTLACLGLSCNPSPGPPTPPPPPTRVLVAGGFTPGESSSRREIYFFNSGSGAFEEP